jgi:hypothetical protein
MDIDGARGYLRPRAWHQLALVRLPLFALVALFTALLSAPTARAAQNPFSGQWATNLGSGITGTVKFSVISESEGTQALQAMGGHLCGAPTTYYHGDYTDTAKGDKGTMTACIVTAGHLVGRYRNSNTATGGDLDITLNAAENGFEGFFTSDEFGGEHYPYSGTFESHFPGDGCCESPTPAPPPPPSEPAPPLGAGSLTPPTSFCPTGATAARVIAHAALRCVTRKSVTNEEKAVAAFLAATQREAVIVVCSLAKALLMGKPPPSTGRGKRIFEEFGALQLGFAFAELCIDEAQVLANGLAIVHDPPDPHFHQVAVPPPRARVSTRGSGRCPKPLSAASCAGLLVASTNYANASAAVAADATATALTANRFTGAVTAGSTSDAFLQAAVGKVYAGELALAMAAEQAAGRALARRLRAAKLDLSLDRRTIKRIGSRLAGEVISKRLLDVLVADGLAANPSQARRVFTTELTGVSGPVDLAAALSATLPSAAFESQYRSIAMSELAAVVNGLAGQGAISSATRQALITDLAIAQAACADPTRRIAAAGKFMTDAGAQVSGPAATLLSDGARPFTASGVPASACE